MCLFAAFLLFNKETDEICEFFCSWLGTGGHASQRDIPEDRKCGKTIFRQVFGLQVFPHLYILPHTTGAYTWKLTQYLCIFVTCNNCINMHRILTDICHCVLGEGGKEVGWCYQ